MAATAVLLVLSAAVLHATWNAIVKSNADGLIAAWAVSAAGAVANFPLLAVVGLPDRGVWILVAVSAVLHVLYSLSLVAAYKRADLSVAYPIARGLAPLIVTVGGFILLDDALTVRGVLGVVLVSAGLGVLASTRPIRHAGWAVITGVFIAAYTLVDGAGVRANGDSAQYIGLGFVVLAVALTLVVARIRGVAAMRAAVVAQPIRLAVGGIASAGAYLLVMVAALTEPLGLVSGLRETSALFGVAIGAIILREKVTPRHALAVALAVVGTFAIAVSGS